MKKKLIIVSFFSLLSHAQIFDSNNFIPSADEAFTLSAYIENQNILVSFKLVPATYIYLDKIFLKDSKFYLFVGEIYMLLPQKNYLFYF